MTKRGTTGKPGKGAFDIVIDLITSRIGKLTTLVGVAGGLVLGILSYATKIREVFVKAFPEAPCVQAEPLTIPATVKYSEWDSVRFKIKGRNNCVTSQGLYVTFVGRDLSEPSPYILRAPYSYLPECQGKTPLEEPKCWDPKRPVSNAKGNWEFEILPPPLERLSDRTGKIGILWGVRNYDAPTDKPYPTGITTIEVRSDKADSL